MAHVIGSEDWIEADGFPDLQKLERKHGGYTKIPREVWEVYDMAMERWKGQVRNGERREQERGG